MKLPMGEVGSGGPMRLRISQGDQKTAGNCNLEITIQPRGQTGGGGVSLTFPEVDRLGSDILIRDNASTQIRQNRGCESHKDFGKVSKSVDTQTSEVEVDRCSCQLGSLRKNFDDSQLRTNRLAHEKASTGWVSDSSGYHKSDKESRKRVQTRKPRRVRDSKILISRKSRDKSQGGKSPPAKTEALSHREEVYRRSSTRQKSPEQASVRSKTGVDTCCQSTSDKRKNLRLCSSCAEVLRNEIFRDRREERCGDCSAKGRNEIGVSQCVGCEARPRVTRHGCQFETSSNGSCGQEGHQRAVQCCNSQSYKSLPSIFVCHFCLAHKGRCEGSGTGGYEVVRETEYLVKEVFPNKCAASSSGFFSGGSEKKPLHPGQKAAGDYCTMTTDQGKFRNGPPCTTK